MASSPISIVPNEPRGTATPVYHNLPAQPTPLLGREQEIKDACALLRRPGLRLLTLLGPPGIGKTRLGVQVAGELVNDFPDGVYFVPLAPIADPGLVLSAIAQTLGLKEGAGQHLADTVKVRLREAQTLLFLDNFEQVVAAAPSIAEILSACPQLKVLVTSRSVLRVRGEHEFDVPPLALPDSKAVSNAAVLSRTEAVALFVQRAQGAKRAFHLTSDNAQAVAEICVRLEGLPLAIELAAARVKVLSPQGILARLSHRLELLTCGPQDLPERQQTLRRAIEWSYDLLDPVEQRLFRRLAVFVGGCTLEAAESVVSPQTAQPGEQVASSRNVLDGLSTLIGKSLLRQVDTEDGEPRFVMLQTILEYGLERLANAGEQEAIRRTHAEFFLALAEAAEPQLIGADQERWIRRLEADHDNIRSVFTWALNDSHRAEAAARVELAARLAMALHWFWSLRGYLTEGRKWLQEVLSRVEVSWKASVDRQADYARLLYCVGRLGWVHKGGLGGVPPLFQESARIWRGLDSNPQSKRGLAYSLAMLALTDKAGPFTERRAYLEECIALLTDIGDKWGLARSLRFLGELSREEGDYATARSFCKEALVLFRDIGDRWGISLSLSGLGEILLDEGAHAAAYAALKEAIDGYRQGGFDLDKRQIAYMIAKAGEAKLGLGLEREAIALFNEGLTLSRQLDMNRVLPFFLECMALVASGRGRVAVAAMLWSAATAIQGARPRKNTIQLSQVHDRKLVEMRARANDDLWERAWSEGSAMSVEQVLQLAFDEQAAVSRESNVRAAQSRHAQPAQIERPTLPAGLTPRESDVLQLVARGLTNAQVAQQLVISPNTVSIHLYSIYSKLGVTSRTAATRIAVDQGLVGPAS